MHEKSLNVDLILIARVHLFQPLHWITEINSTANANWQEVDQLVFYKRRKGIEPRHFSNTSSRWSEHDFKSCAPNTWPSSLTVINAFGMVSFLFPLREQGHIPSLPNYESHGTWLKNTINKLITKCMYANTSVGMHFLTISNKEAVYKSTEINTLRIKFGHQLGLCGVIWIGSMYY